MKINDKTARPCPFCPKTFSVEGLKSHLISEHLDLPNSKENKPDEPNFRCEKCDKNFKLEKNYKRHVISLHENEDKENETTVGFNDEFKVIETKQDSAIKGNERQQTLDAPKVRTRASSRQSLPLAMNNPKPKLYSPLALKIFNESKGVEAKQVTPSKGNGTPQVKTRTSTRRQSLPSALNNPKSKLNSSYSPLALKVFKKSAKQNIPTKGNGTPQVRTRTTSFPLAVNNPKLLNSQLALNNDRLTKLLATNSITLIKEQKPSVPANPTIPPKLASILNSKSISIIKASNIQPSRTPNSSVKEPQVTGSKPTTSIAPNTGSFSFKCKACQKEFNQVKALQLHMKVLHSAKYPCKHCKKVFANPIDLKNHVTQSCFKAYQETINKSGTKKKKTNFDCGSCGKVFATVKFLENHTKAYHSKALTFHCFKCGNNYEDFSKLVAHISSTHKTSKSNECSWTCPTCDDHFDKELALLIHMGISHPGMTSTEVVKKPNLTKNPRIFQPQIQLKRLTKQEIAQWKQ